MHRDTMWTNMHTTCNDCLPASYIWTAIKPIRYYMIRVGFWFLLWNGPDQIVRNEVDCLRFGCATFVYMAIARVMALDSINNCFNRYWLVPLYYNKYDIFSNKSLSAQLAHFYKRKYYQECIHLYTIQLLTLGILLLVSKVKLNRKKLMVNPNFIRFINWQNKPK